MKRWYYKRWVRPITFFCLRIVGFIRSEFHHILYYATEGHAPIIRNKNTGHTIVVGCECEKVFFVDCPRFMADYTEWAHKQKL